MCFELCHEEKGPPPTCSRGLSPAPRDLPHLLPIHHQVLRALPPNYNLPLSAPPVPPCHRPAHSLLVLKPLRAAPDRLLLPLDSPWTRRPEAPLRSASQARHLSSRGAFRPCLPRQGFLPETTSYLPSFAQAHRRSLPLPLSLLARTARFAPEFPPPLEAAQGRPT